MAADAPAAANDVLPRRQLGKNGPQVTMLCMGGMMAALSPDYIDIAWSMGIRYFDTADCYLKGKSEGIFGAWLAKYPERRKEIFLVSKDHPHQGPEQLLEMIDKRLAACGTTYLDAFYIHGLGPREYGDDSLNWPKSDAFKKTAETLKKSGKVKMVGFSCHDGRLPDYLNAAAEGGFGRGPWRAPASLAPRAPAPAGSRRTGTCAGGRGPGGWRRPRRRSSALAALHPRCR